MSDLTRSRRLCRCPCHTPSRGDWEAARQMKDWSAAMIASDDPTINAIIAVDTDDPKEAAVASGCLCLDNHCDALLTRAGAKRPPVEVGLWLDGQADGEGQETA